MIRNIIEAAHNAGIWVGMCGEMAGEPALALILLGLGLDEFSIPPLAIPEVKYVIRAVTLAQARDIATESLKLSTGKEVEEFSQANLS
jgi:phosphoenolpyruvate-protein kinase (PTS system EI component)